MGITSIARLITFFQIKYFEVLCKYKKKHLYVIYKLYMYINYFICVILKFFNFIQRQLTTFDIEF